MMLPNAAAVDDNVPVYFLHIPKTAGSTLNSFFRTVYPPEKISPYWGWHQLLNISNEELLTYQLYSGHFYSYFHKLVSTPLRYCTFLRDPIDRALSHYGHIIKDNTHYLHKHALALGDFSAYIRDESVRFTISNFQARALALDADPFVLASTLSQEQLESYELERMLESIEFNLSDKELLDIAKQNLEQFCFIGITERFEESLKLLCHTFNWSVTSEIQSTNVNNDRVAREKLSEEDMSILKKLNEADFELYEYAKNIFEKNLTRMSTSKVFVSYSQNFEDVMLWRALKHISRGFYIDIGAWSPDLDSVTRAFYQDGWKGINIEPNPVFLDSYERRRPRDVNLCLALGDKTGETEMFFVSNSGLSTINADYAYEYNQAGLEIRTSHVKVDTLQNIWEQYVGENEVHFLKIDVEGFEAQVLKGNDWGKNRPWILLIEATRPGCPIPSYQDWEPILISNNYLMAYADGLNRYYIAKEHQDLLDAFKYPPNVFDNFILASVFEARKTDARMHEINKELEIMKKSLSWRITKPLRVLRKLTRKRL
jgi:FkbM family methyltransferase